MVCLEAVLEEGLRVGPLHEVSWVLSGRAEEECAVEVEDDEDTAWGGEHSGWEIGLFEIDG